MAAAMHKGGVDAVAQPRRSVFAACLQLRTKQRLSRLRR